MFGSTRIVGLGLAAAVSLVVGVTSAQAASLPIPNDGFETPCSGVPCNWSGTSGSMISWDNTLHHNGNASLALKSIGTPGIVAVSTCIPASASTTYNIAVWYRTLAAISRIDMFLNTYTSSDCSGSPFAPAGAFTNSPVTTGTWTRLIGQTMTGAGIQSVKVDLSFACASTCPANLIVNFDDVVARTEGLAVSVASLSARPVAKGVLLRWRTGTEADLLGFQVYRSRARAWRRVTKSLIAAKGSVSGASYRFLDRTARRSVHYRYRIKAVNRDGTTSWFGPVRAT